MRNGQKKKKRRQFCKEKEETGKTLYCGKTTNVVRGEDDHQGQSM
jgi:hypothetical protein